MRTEQSSVVIAGAGLRMSGRRSRRTFSRAPARGPRSRCGLPSGLRAVEVEEDGDGLVARYLDEHGRLVGGAVVDRPQVLAALRRELLGVPSPAGAFGA